MTTGLNKIKIPEDASAAELREFALELEAFRYKVLDEADRRHGPKDVYVEGTVLTFQKPGSFRRSSWGEEYFGDDVYVGQLKYAAIKAGQAADCWFLTGNQIRPLTWRGLLDFIGEQNYDTVSTVGPQVRNRPAWAVER